MSSSQTLPPPQGPEYVRCSTCSHIEPEHQPNAGPCLVCDCAAYSPVDQPASSAVSVVPPATNQTAEAAPVKQRADLTETEWAEQERARFERLYTRETVRADLAEQRAETAARDADIYQQRLERLSEGYTEQRKRAEAMERAMESTAADALKHRGCHRDLMAQCLRAERAEAEAGRLRTDRSAILTAAASRYEEILANADTGQDPRYWTAVRDITLGLRAMAVEAPQTGAAASCGCGEPSAPGTVHRADGPCYIAEAHQPDTQTDEAHPAEHTWKVESPRRDTWASWGATYDERDWASERYESAISNAPGRPLRLVRATTTYTVEAEHAPAVSSRPGTEQEA